MPYPEQEFSVTFVIEIALHCSVIFQRILPAWLVFGYPYRISLLKINDYRDDMPPPEELARENIDKQLTACGWTIQSPAAMNLYAARGVAVREFPLATEEAGLVRAASKARSRQGEDLHVR